MSDDSLRHFLKTPKGLTIAVLVPLGVIAAVPQGWRFVLPETVAATAAAMLVDLFVLRARKGRWVFPDGALITGLLVGMVLSPHERWWVAGITAAVAVASKYLLRVRRANVFNPAALGLVATFYLFNTGQSWWGALTELPMIALVLLIGSGVFVADRLRKMPCVVAFLGVYYTLVTTAAFVGEPRHVAELFRTPDLHAALFFAFYMVTDPPTSPGRAGDQVWYGAIVAVVAFTIFETIGAAYWLLAGVLVGNVWDAWHRHRDSLRRKQLHASVV